MEFKRSIDAVETKDLVAIANTASGGAILVGVAEAEGRDGSQIGRVVGCEVGDRARMKILDRALSCVPPIPLDVFVENTRSKPFLRVEIPPSRTRPHCTRQGTYTIRADGRIKALHPDELLSMFLETEAKVFRERFREVTLGIERDLSETKSTVSQLEGEISSSVARMESTLGWTEDHAQDAASKIDDVAMLLANLQVDVSDNEDRMTSLLTHLEVQDPVKERARTRILKRMIEDLTERSDLLSASKFEVTISGPETKLFSEDELRAVLDEAVAQARAKVAASNHGA